MKILSVEEIRKGDAFTMEHEPVSDIDLMERAAASCCKWLKNILKKNSYIKIFCGPGNNGGDGLAISRMLLKDNYKVVTYLISHSGKISESCRENLAKLKKSPKAVVIELNETEALPILDNKDIVIDALFGSGLNKPVAGFIAEVIRRINDSGALVVAVDVPSGLFCDQSMKNSQCIVVMADYTLSFEFPKLAFLMPENDDYVGEWIILPIRIHPDFISAAETRNFLLTKDVVCGLVKKRHKYSHKGVFGHALLISGSYGRTGAAVLAAKACMRSGTGLLTVHVPKSSYTIIQSAVPEAMTSVDEDESIFSGIKDLQPYNAIGIGPGIGTDKKTQTAFKLLIQGTNTSLVIDADAINILGENKTWLPFLPHGSILTPHPKEFERITHKTTDDFERLELQRELSVRFGIYVILKGAHTSITFPDGKCFFNTTGNPGMATGGSGDVLTGIILGLKARGYTPAEASLIGVFLHGMAGDIASGFYTPEAMIAGDIIQFIGKAFRKIYQKNI